MSKLFSLGPTTSTPRLCSPSLLPGKRGVRDVYCVKASEWSNREDLIAAARKTPRVDLRLTRLEREVDYKFATTHKQQTHTLGGAVGCVASWLFAGHAGGITLMAALLLEGQNYDVMPFDELAQVSGAAGALTVLASLVTGIQGIGRMRDQSYAALGEAGAKLLKVQAQEKEFDLRETLEKEASLQRSGKLAAQQARGESAAAMIQGKFGDAGTAVWHSESDPIELSREAFALLARVESMDDLRHTLRALRAGTAGN